MSSGRSWRSSASVDGGGSQSNINNIGDEDSVCSETSSQAHNRTNNRYRHYRRKDAPAAGNARAKPWMRDKVATTTKIKRISRIRNGSLLAEATATTQYLESVSSNQSVGSSASGNHANSSNNNNTSIMSSPSCPPVHEIQNIPVHTKISQLQEPSMLSMDEDAMAMPPPLNRPNATVNSTTTTEPTATEGDAPSDHTFPSVVALGDAFVARTNELEPTETAAATHQNENNKDDEEENDREPLPNNINDNDGENSTAAPPAEEIHVHHQPNNDDDASAITNMTGLTQVTTMSVKIGDQDVFAARLANVAVVSAAAEEDHDNSEDMEQKEANDNWSFSQEHPVDDTDGDDPTAEDDNKQDLVAAKPTTASYNPMSASSSSASNNKESTKKSFSSFFAASAAQRMVQQRDVGELVAGQGELLNDAIVEVSEDEGTVEEEDEEDEQESLIDVVAEQDPPVIAEATTATDMTESVAPATASPNTPEQEFEAAITEMETAECTSAADTDAEQRPAIKAGNTDAPVAEETCPPAPRETHADSTMNNMPMEEKKEEDNELARRTRDLEVTLEDNVRNLRHAQEELSRLEEANAELVERLHCSEEAVHAAEDAMASRSKDLEETLHVNVETIQSLKEELRQAERSNTELSQKVHDTESQIATTTESIKSLTKARDEAAAWQSKRCRQQCRNYFRHVRMSQHESHGVKDKSPIQLTVPYHPLGPDLQGLFDTWKEMDAEDTTFLFRSLDVYNKGHYYSHKLLVPWKLVVREEDQSLAGSSSLSRQEFFAQVWALVGGLKAKIGEEFEIPLFSACKVGGLVPTCDDDFIKLLRMPKAEVEEMFLEHILPYYRAVGRMMAQRIAEVAGDKNSNENSKITGHIMPMLYRNKFFRGLEPTDELYPFRELLQHALAVLDVRFVSTEEAMTYFGIDRANSASDEEAIQQCREIIQSMCLERYSLALQAIEEGLTLNGLLDLSLCFGLMPSDMVDELIFSELVDV